ncbi:hypothetical protein EXIGLDRAFT_746523 [Exidia glandulosa HHB12029]|uniref:CBM21 domain-containing protein n=1 Tax=Exidia glandulosa HHB12029 TaxID=1314781 RepID=A0A165M1W8_EXIGL|nr:hypothetical protein EXIGLDRAFT_746523 [Exidia glandulosa HHB12029]
MSHQFPMPYILPHDTHTDALESASEAASSSRVHTPPASTSADVQHVPFPCIHSHDSFHTSHHSRSSDSRPGRSTSLKSCLKPKSRQNSPPPAQTTLPSPPKLVHYPSQDIDLKSVRIFKLRGKPLAISRPDEETETETEGYDSGSIGSPFLALAGHADETYIIDSSQSSVVPATTEPPHADIYLETIQLPPVRALTLCGSVLVRNFAFSKFVVVRFSLDNWVTTSEVNATYVASMPSIPPPFHDDDAWDRFSFQINLADKILRGRTLSLAVRYQAAGGEWWDNNNGTNYALRFVPSPSSNAAAARRAATRSAEQDIIPRTTSPLSIFDTSRPDPTVASPLPRRHSGEIHRASRATSRSHAPLHGWWNRSQDMFPPSPSTKRAHLGRGPNELAFGTAFPKQLSVLRV